MTFQLVDDDFSFYKSFSFFEEKQKLGEIEEFSINER